MLKAITAHFVVSVDGVRINCTKGSVPNYFVEEIKAVSLATRAFKGKIYGMPRKGYVQLEFSSSVPETTQQRLRNVWRHQPVKSSKPGLRK